MARYRYDPWGAAEYEMPGSVQNPLRYTGREWDAETGLYYYRARHYDSQIGRFIPRTRAGAVASAMGWCDWGDPITLPDVWVYGSADGEWADDLRRGAQEFGRWGGRR